jgi:hypothetical protein
MFNFYYNFYIILRFKNYSFYIIIIFKRYHWKGMLDHFHVLDAIDSQWHGSWHGPTTQPWMHTKATPSSKATGVSTAPRWSRIPVICDEWSSIFGVQSSSGLTVTRIRGDAVESLYSATISMCLADHDHVGSQLSPRGLLFPRSESQSHKAL